LIWQIAAVALGLVGIPLFAISVLTLLVAGASWATWLFTLGTTAMPLVAAALGWWMGSRVKPSQNEQLGRARRLVAEEILRSDQFELTSAALAQALGIPESQADYLLAELSVDDRVHSRVTDVGEVVYSTRSPGRVRVETEAATEEDSDDYAENFDSRLAAARSKDEG
jgi:hypothetical protein